MTYLVISLFVLAVGPVLYRLFQNRPQMLSFLDGFNFVAIAGLIFLDALPESIRDGGPWVLGVALAGLFVPTVIEHQFRRGARRSHLVALFLGIVGLCLHSLLDGAALVESISGELSHDHDHDGHGSHLPFAVILHRIPVGLTIWLLLRPQYGTRVAFGILTVIALATVAGFFAGSQVGPDLPAQATAAFKALVAGSLLHVVVHRPHFAGTEAAEKPSGHGPLRPEGIGGALGLTLLGGLIASEALLLSSDLGRGIARAFVELSLESAPALILGYVLAGTLQAFLPAASIRWMGRGNGLSQSLRGMAVGLPIPVCSCGVVPIYQTLIQRGAPASAAMAFMVATPELGVDAVLLSIPLLGIEMTVIRVVGAAIVALVIGWAIGRLARKETRAAENGVVAGDSGPRPLKVRLREAMTFGFGELLDHTAPWILVGLSIAALVEPLLDPRALDWLPQATGVFVFALLGVPTYVCASGATPLVAVLLLKGVSPGAALAFLLTGPATNVTTFGVLGKLHGRRVALSFSVTIMALSVGLGLLVNWFFPGAGADGSIGGRGHEMRVVQIVCLALLVLAYASSILRRGPREFAREIFDPDAEGESGGSHDHSHHHDCH